MFPAISLARVISAVGHDLFYSKVERKLIGIVLARPQLEFSKREILPHINYWNNRSSSNIDFFFGGYAEEGAVGIPERQPIKVGIGDKYWLFSDSLYTEFLENIESESQYSHSGGADFILAIATYNWATNKALIDFRSAAVCDLEVMISKEKMVDVSRFFEQILRTVRTGDAETPIKVLDRAKSL
jgi:hypothetical protein